MTLSILTKFIITGIKEPWWRWSIREPSTIDVSITLKNRKAGSPCQIPAISKANPTRASVAVLTVMVYLLLANRSE